MQTNQKAREKGAEQCRRSVRSIVGRFLEHSRILYFENGGQPDLYLGSADWMSRNFYERVELMFPTKSPHLRERLFDEILQSYLKDNDKARMLRQDGTMHAFYTPAIPDSGVTAIVLVHRSFSLTSQSKDTSPQKPKQRTSPTSLPIDVKNHSPQPARVCDMSSSFPDPRRRDASALEEFIAWLGFSSDNRVFHFADVAGCFPATCTNHSGHNQALLQLSRCKCRQRASLPALQGQIMKTSDKALGMNEPICRRDFLNSTLLASGALLMKSMSPLQLMAQQAGPKTGGLSESDWNGPNTGIGDYQRSNGNTWEVVNGGHDVRFGVFERGSPEAADTGEIFDCVVVGGGLAGLSAAWTFKKKAGAKRTCLILENHPMFGGEAKRNELMVDGHRIMGPQGSNLIWAPDPGSYLEDFLLDINLDWQHADYVPWGGPDPAMELSRTSYSWIYIMPPNFGFYFGRGFGQPTGSWMIDPWGKRLEGALFSAQVRQDMLKWWNAHGNAERQGRRGDPSDTDPRAFYLDSITQEQRIMEEYGVSREMVRQFLSPLAATGYGLGCDALSGFATPSYYRLLHDKNQFSFPGGNAGIARHTVKALIPDALPGPANLESVTQTGVSFNTLDRPENPVRMRLRCTVVRVEHEGEPEKSDYVRITYTRDGKLYRLKARSVVMASPQFVNKHVISDLDAAHREAAGHFHYAAHLSLNVAVRNWRFLHKLGISGARWFGGFGEWTEVRNPMVCGSDLKTFGPDSPVFLTLYVPFMNPGAPVQDQCEKGRYELISTPYRDIERKMREQFAEMFSGSGFDPKRDIAGAILNRWGHAFIVAPPGFYFGKDGKPAPREVFRNQPFGRISFGHSDVNGDPSGPGAIQEGHRAAGQAIKALA